MTTATTTTTETLDLPEGTFGAVIDSDVPAWLLQEGDVLLFDPAGQPEDGKLCLCNWHGANGGGGVLRFKGDRYVDHQNRVLPCAKLECKGVFVAVLRYQRRKEAAQHEPQP